MVIFKNEPDFDIEQVVRDLGPRIVQTSGQDYTIAQHEDDPTDCSDRTDYFDWHCDGLYHAKPPRFVLLHCINPGLGLVHTELANTELVMGQMSAENYLTLSNLRSHYIGHGGRFDHRIIRRIGMIMASRGYVSPLPDLLLEDVPSIRDIGSAMAELYRALDENAKTYEWKAGDTLIFDQYLYMHRRNSAVIDRDRKLIRLWYN